MRVHGNGRGRKAVLSALASAGEQGMSLFALGVAVELPEVDLLALLNRLVLSGHVRCLGNASGAPAGRAMYRLTDRTTYIPAPRHAV